MAYVFAAYTIIWLGVLGYTFHLAQHQKRLSAQVEALERALQACGEQESASQTGRA
ncbi:MAG TPA: CcmD family protein [Limnochordia bacterium]|nr:CcmD family protein [Limnochordia bacterium]